MRTAIIAGATGAVGSCLLKELIESEEYEKIFVLLRSDKKYDSPKVKPIICSFDNLDELNMSENFDDCFCCLGTTQKKAGSKEAFRRVDHDYVLEFAKLCQKNKAKTFSVISSLGANIKSSSFYLMVKGETEKDLKVLNLPCLIIYRPSLLHGDRNEFRFAESSFYYVLKIVDPLLFGKLRAYKPTYIPDLAKIMYEKAIVFCNDDSLSKVVILEGGEMLK